MSTVDSEPIPFDARHNRAERAAVRLVESAGWKVTASVITIVLLPLCAWGLSTVVDRLGKIDASIGAFTTESALMQRDVRSIQLDNQRQDAENARQNVDIRTLQDRQAEITFKLDSLRSGPERAR